MPLRAANAARELRALDRNFAINGVHYPSRRAAMQALAPRVAAFDDVRARVITTDGSFFLYSDLSVAAVKYLKTIKSANP